MHSIILLIPIVIGQGKCFNSYRSVTPQPQSQSQREIPNNHLTPKNADIPEPITNPNTNPTLREDCLSLHNRAREALGVPSLTWSSVLESTAQSWAKTMSESGFRHSHSGVGENLYDGGSGSCEAALAAWLAEATRVANPDDPISLQILPQIGHYSQVVWSKTTHVGCGTFNGNFVCQYTPPGNTINQRPF